MSALTIIPENEPSRPVLHSDDPEIIARELAAVGIQFERWEAAADIRAGDSPETVMAAYREDIDRLVAQRDRPGHAGVEVPPHRFGSARWDGDGDFAAVDVDGDGGVHHSGVDDGDRPLVAVD